jgi:hypothetical protein
MQFSDNSSTSVSRLLARGCRASWTQITVTCCEGSCPKWGNIADTLRHLVTGELSPEMFCDLGFALAHNNGPIFNKGKHPHPSYWAARSSLRQRGRT